ncbi:MAG: hypothetical protein Ct9H300mP14_15230 [Gammaproteobacteria bacterium]|nr:MAG: hypothetical protein Ct9H300mP14_15230 [Gammaproteobacteria bacterium]
MAKTITAKILIMSSTGTRVLLVLASLVIVIAGFKSRQYHYCSAANGPVHRHNYNTVHAMADGQRRAQMGCAGSHSPHARRFHPARRFTNQFLRRPVQRSAPSLENKLRTAIRC